MGDEPACADERQGEPAARLDELVRAERAKLGHKDAKDAPESAPAHHSEKPTKP